MTPATRETIADEIATLHTLNETLRQPNLHDGPRAEAQKARGICLANIRQMLTERVRRIEERGEVATALKRARERRT